MALLGIALMLAARAALGAIGFTATGIAGGSIAASLMSVATIASGGAMSTGTVLGAAVAAAQHIAMVAL